MFLKTERGSVDSGHEFFFVVGIRKGWRHEQKNRVRNLLSLQDSISRIGPVSHSSEEAQSHSRRTFCLFKCLVNGTTRRTACRAGRTNRFELCHQRSASLPLEVPVRCRDLWCLVWDNFLTSISQDRLQALKALRLVDRSAYILVLLEMT